MNKSLYICRIINILILITLFILNFNNIGGTIPLIILTALFIINSIILIRLNNKQRKHNDANKTNQKNK